MMTSSVYRTSAREVDEDEVTTTKPTMQALLAPLRRAAIPVLITAIPTFFFNLSVRIVSFASGRTLRLVGWADILENVLVALITLSSGFLIVLIARTIRSGAWRGLGRARTLAWCAKLVAIQTIVVLFAVHALFWSRGEGPALSGSQDTLQRTSMSDDGRVAYLYSSVEPRLHCNYRLYVAVPFSLVMAQEGFYPKRSCSEPTPSIDWGSSYARLVDHKGERMEPYSTGWSIFLFH